MSQPAISHHLRILKNADLITENRKGLWNVYSINSQNIYFPLVKDILSYFPSQEEKLDWLERQGLRIIYD
ncbi:ArsR family transcriptional regulator [Neobacillus ginsengisoli]|uniref:ArsR family transcriptional regulator n=1 Tax=Neobacillus ginsengisoli TaxID=904295 RepID=UPI003522AA93